MSHDTCAFAGCARPRKALNLCRGHYGQQYRGRALTPLHDWSNRRPCGFDQCDRPQSAKGLCRGHYEQQRAGRELAPIRTGKRSRPGDTYVDPQGYVRVYVPGHSARREWPKQHRWIVEQEIGRPLLPTENVHHKNGVKSDNRRENLELWVTSQPSGQRPCDLVVWAREILERYGEMVDAAA